MTASTRVSGRRHPRRTQRSKLWFATPLILFLIAFAVFPLIQLVRMSLSAVTSSTVNHDWDFVGLDNFAADLAGGDLQSSVWRTVVFVGVVTAVGMAGGFGVALALRRSTVASSILLGLMVFIWALPPVVTGSVWKFLLGDTGLFNSILGSLGLTQHAVPFLYDPTWALVCVAVVNSWAVIPFNALVYRAAFLNIPDELFEAAQLDGARRYQEVRYIMSPSVQPTTLVLSILTVVYAFRSFDFIYVMTFGGPGTATNTLPFLAYLQAFVRYDFGLGSATAVVAVLLVLVLAAVYARSVFREENE